MAKNNEKVLLPVVSEGAKKLPTDKYHISYSEFMDWHECSERHRLKHIKKLGDDGPSVHTEFGGIIHDALEQYLANGQDLNVEATKEKITEAFKLIPGLEMNQEELERDWLSSVGPMFEAFPGFLEKQFKNFTFVDAEFALMENLVKKKDRFFKGFVDCILKAEDSKGEEVYWILDYKTTSWGWDGNKKRDPFKQMQLLLYKHFWGEKNNIPMDKIKCGWILLKRDVSRGDNQRIEFVPFASPQDAIEKALGQLYAMINSIEKGIFTKNRYACRFCPFANTEHCT